MNEKFFSRKFLVTIGFSAVITVLPVAYLKAGLSETITLTVISLLGAAAAGYGIINLKETKLDIEAAKKDQDAA